GKATKGKACNTKRRANDGASRGYKRKLEYVLGTITKIFPARESNNQPCTRQRLKRVASGNGKRCRDVPCVRYVDQKRADKDGRPDAIPKNEDCCQGNSG